MIIVSNLGKGWVRWADTSLNIHLYYRQGDITMKKLFRLILSFILVISLSLSVHAAENTQSIDTEALGDVVTHREYSMIMQSNINNEIKPRYTVFDDIGGTTTLDYLSGGYIHWSVRPNTVDYYTFAGTMEIRDSNDRYIGSDSCFAAGTGFQSGLVDLSSMGLTHGKMYTAVFSGRAINTNGDVFTVVSSAQIPFMY